MQDDVKKALREFKDLERLAVNATQGDYFYLGREQLQTQRKFEFWRRCDLLLGKSHQNISLTIQTALKLLEQVQSGEKVVVTPDKVDNWNYGDPPKDGGVFYGKYYSPYKWKPYKPQARKQGYPAGRWQSMNEYGGWDNAKNIPQQWLTEKDFNEKEKAAPDVKGDA